MLKVLTSGERIIYQIYPKSWQDSNHDGIGDLNGITSRLDYLRELGINTLWLNPIFVSPQVDNGYDVENYFMVDPSLGTMDDFENLVREVHARGMEIILDFVMNHTSDQHPWFKDAISDPHSLYRDYYLWQPAPQEGQLPNNWASFFGGSVWEKDPGGSNEYYFHLFAKEMPDLNWKNQEVRRAMSEIGQFWLERGVDGFRLDAFIHTAKANFAQNVFTAEPEQLELAEEYYANLPQAKEYLEEFIASLRTIKPDLFILGEAASADLDLAASYTDPHRNLCDSVVTFRYFADDPDQEFDSQLPRFGQPHRLDLRQFRQTMVHWQTVLQDWSYPTLYWSNHDLPRILDKFVGVSEHDQPALAKMLAALMYLQRGIPCIYYGEELGMTAGKLADPAEFGEQEVEEFLQAGLKLGDAQADLLQSLSASRKMGARTVMQWSDGVNAGFSEQTPWLKAQPTPANVLIEKKDPASVLNFYRQVLALKKQPLFVQGSITFDLRDPELYVYTRQLGKQTAIVYCNLSANLQQLDLSDAALQGRVQLKNQAQIDSKHRKLTLNAYGTLVLATTTVG